MCAVSACEDPIDEQTGSENNGSENNGSENNGNNQNVTVNFPDLIEDYEVKPGSELTLKLRLIIVGSFQFLRKFSNTSGFLIMVSRLINLVELLRIKT